MKERHLFYFSSYYEKDKNKTLFFLEYLVFFV